MIPFCGVCVMKFPVLLIALGSLAATPALAWSGSTQAGDYRVTATLDGASHLQSVALAPQSGTAARPMQVHAWFVDSEGAILGQAPLGAANPNGITLIAAARGTPVPSAATSLVVMAQPAGLTRTASAAQPAILAQIALP
jgi:hypothetical protein